MPFSAHELVERLGQVKHQRVRQMKPLRLSRNFRPVRAKARQLEAQLIAFHIAFGRRKSGVAHFSPYHDRNERNCC